MSSPPPPPPARRRRGLSLLDSAPTVDATTTRQTLEALQSSPSTDFDVSSQEMESSFTAFYRQRHYSLLSLRRLYLIIIAVMLLYSILQYLVGGLRGEEEKLMVLLCGGVAPFIAGFAVLLLPPCHGPFLQRYVPINSVLCSLLFIALLHSLPDEQYLLGNSREFLAFLVIASPALLFRLRFIPAAVLSLVLCAYFVFFTLLTGVESVAEYPWHMCNLALGWGVFAYMAYVLEKNARLDFLMERVLDRRQTQLREEVSSLQRRLSVVEDGQKTLEAPLHTCLRSVKRLRSSAVLSASDLEAIDMFVESVRTMDMWTPEVSMEDVDDDLADYLDHMMLVRRNTQHSSISSTERSPRERGMSDSRRSSLSLAFGGFSELDGLLATAPTTWTIDTDAIAEQSHGQPLFSLGMYLFSYLGLVDHFDLHDARLVEALHAIEAGYGARPYHNSLHAADTVHSVSFYMLCHGKERSLYEGMQPLETLALLVAAAIHDVDHPGFGNSFLIATSDARALVYNDRAVLENHHLSFGFHILLKPECAILSALTKLEYNTIRALIIDIVLATDLAGHFGYVSKLRSLMDPDTGLSELELSEQNKLLILQMAMKTADVAHPTKKWRVHAKWTKAIAAEFYLQGDRERELELEISSMMDRNKEDVPKSQLGFIDFVVSPAFELWSQYLGKRRFLTNLAVNRNNWLQLSELGKTTLDSMEMLVIAESDDDDDDSEEDDFTDDDVARASSGASGGYAFGIVEEEEEEDYDEGEDSKLQDDSDLVPLHIVTPVDSEE
eukprot:PLAT9195.2.p1 GENE.PLAT9195.2~~PLAT9195.2.p1  ORF type:complete len:780 (-),score=322.07 PLAT9195.2:526-2865(-)